MHRPIIRIALSGMLGLLMLAGFAAQNEPSPGSHPTGLIPLDAAQVQKIRASWPRVIGSGLNWLGFERVNAVRSARGKSPLEPLSVGRVGREIISSIPAAGVASVQANAANLLLSADLPTSVDNSTLKFFPPIRSQGSLGSCASFSITYYQLSYMAALQRDLDIRDDGDDTNKYSPKWAYNMINGGSDSGSYFDDNYEILASHGAATWAEFPYDSDFKAWCLTTSAWRNALDVRTDPGQYLWDVSEDSGLELVKELLSNGYILVFGTYIYSWQFGDIVDDPSTTEDDSEVGEDIGYWLDGYDGAHAMTIVGYNDAIWTDINGNGIVDEGEKGAFRIANSWGIAWRDGGFTWLAYDALRSSSAVLGGPSSGRVPAFQSDMAFLLTVRDVYSPSMIAEFTVNHAKRDQLRLSLGSSATSVETPSTTWTPAAFQNQGGAYAFDGSATALDGTFVLDYTDILVAGGGTLRYYLGINDNAAGDTATLSAFKIVDLTTNPDTEVVSSLVPRTADGGQQAYSYVDYAYTGPAYNHSPELLYPQVDPESGGTSDDYTFYVYYYDQDGDIPSVKSAVIDETSQAMTFLSGNSASDGWYVYSPAALAAGTHSYYFSFEDGQGGSARCPVAGTMSGPEVYSSTITSLSPSSATAGGSAFTLTVNGSGFASGSVVTWDGSDRTTTFVSSSRLDAAILAADLAVGKLVPVVVRAPGGSLSNSLNFTVNNPVPVLTSLSTTKANGGGPGFTLTLSGSNFVANSVARWDGAGRTTTYVSASEIRAAILENDLLAGGPYAVTVVNPIPAGGTSGTIYVTVADFTMAASPASASVTAGQSATFTVTVTPQNGSFDSAVSFACLGLPKGCKATFSPANVTPGASAVTTSMTLTTTARSSSAAGATSRPSGPFPPALALLLLVPVFLSQLRALKPAFRRIALRSAAACALLCLVVLLSSCGAGGGGSQDSGTPAGTYGLQAQGTSGNLRVTADLTLVVD